MSGYSSKGHETDYNHAFGSQADSFFPLFEQGFVPPLGTVEWYPNAVQSYATTPSNASPNSLYFPHNSGYGSSTVRPM